MKRMAAVLMAIMAAGAILAARAETESAWGLCQPDSYVNVRWSPSTKSSAEGQLYMGDEIQLDGEKSGKWLHCIVSTESGEGWIRSDYVCMDEPEETNESVYEITRNRTRVRASAGGRVIKMLKKGTRVTVYLKTEEWCVTNLGFIATEFLNEIQP